MFCVCVCVILMSYTIISVCPALVAPCLCTLAQECIMFHIMYGMVRMCVCVCDVNTCLSSLSLSLFLAAFVVSDIVWLTSHGCHNFHNIASPYYCMLILAHFAPFWPSWCLSPLKITYFYYLICDEILAGETGSCLPLMKHTLTCTHCGHIGTTWDT